MASSGKRDRMLRWSREKGGSGSGLGVNSAVGHVGQTAACSYPSRSGANSAPDNSKVLSFKYRLMLMSGEFEALELENHVLKEELRLVRLQQEEDASSAQGKRPRKETAHHSELHGYDGVRRKGAAYDSEPDSYDGVSRKGTAYDSEPDSCDGVRRKGAAHDSEPRSGPRSGNRGELYDDSEDEQLQTLDRPDVASSLKAAPGWPPMESNPLRSPASSKGGRLRSNVSVQFVKQATPGGTPLSTLMEVETPCRMQELAVAESDAHPVHPGQRSAAESATPSAFVIGAGDLSPACETSNLTPRSPSYQSELSVLSRSDRCDGRLLLPARDPKSETMHPARTGRDFESSDLGFFDASLLSLEVMAMGSASAPPVNHSEVSIVDDGNILPLWAQVSILKSPVTSGSISQRQPVWSDEAWTELQKEEEEDLAAGFGFPGRLLSPKWAGRVLWDVAWCFFCALELLVLPNQMVLGWKGIGVTVIMLVVSLFFFADLVVNFSTGYRDEDDRCVMERTKIIQNYLRSWFLVDLLAWVPIDLLVPGLLRWNCVLRAAKIPVVVRRVWMRAQISSELRWRGRRMMRPDTFDKVTLAAKGLLLLAVFSFVLHLHVCVWIALVEVDHDCGYLVSCCKVFLSFARPGAISVHSDGSPLRTARSPGGLLVYLLFEVTVAIERLILVWVFVEHVVLRLAQRVSDDNVAMDMVKDDALKYLKRNSVSPDTQGKVLRCLSVTRSVNLAKQHFIQVSGELPKSLNQKICMEMWESRLMSFQLIGCVASWCPEFVSELATRVFEDTLPSMMVLFERDGSGHDAAFHILEGMLQSRDEPELLFTEGDWVGETCLISPSLCPGLTIETRSICRLMVVPVREFHDLIDTSEIREQYSLFCSNHLVRGICGRCGAFGDHMPNECPKLQTQSSKDGGVLLKSFKTLSGLGLSPEKSQSRTLCLDLKEFLRVHGLERLTARLQRLGIYSTDDLIGVVRLGSLDFLKAEMQDQHGEAPRLEESEESALSLENIERFQKRLKEMIARTMKHNPAMDRQHLVFLSHYKFEAGTEASLLREEILNSMDEHVANLFEVPVFLDSETLRDLRSLKRLVLQSHNLALLLTKGVLMRPWCLIEVVLANRFDVPIIPIEVIKPGVKFSYPDNAWYDELLAGNVLKESDLEILATYSVTLQDVSVSLRALFRNIAVQYSPHRAASIRCVEVEALLGRCVLSGDLNARNEQAAQKVKDAGHCEADAAPMEQSLPHLC